MIGITFFIQYKGLFLINRLIWLWLICSDMGYKAILIFLLHPIRAGYFYLKK